MSFFAFIAISILIYRVIKRGIQNRGNRTESCSDDYANAEVVLQEIHSLIDYDLEDANLYENRVREIGKKNLIESKYLFVFLFHKYSLCFVSSFKHLFLYKSFELTQFNTCLVDLYYFFNNRFLGLKLYIFIFVKCFQS